MNDKLREKPPQLENLNQQPYFIPEKETTKKHFHGYHFSSLKVYHIYFMLFMVFVVCSRKTNYMQNSKMSDGGQ